MSKAPDISHSVPFGRAYWVVPGKLLAGFYPGDDNQAESYRKLKGLLDHGIRHVVSLMEPDERNHSGKMFKPYDLLMKSIAEAQGLEVTFSRMPIRDYDIPTLKEMTDILDLIDQKLGANLPVYVHCWGGPDRHGGGLLSGEAWTYRRPGWPRHDVAAEKKRFRFPHPFSGNRRAGGHGSFPEKRKMSVDD